MLPRLAVGCSGLHPQVLVLPGLTQKACQALQTDAMMRHQHSTRRVMCVPAVYVPPQAVDSSRLRRLAVALSRRMRVAATDSATGRCFARPDACAGSVRPLAVVLPRLMLVPAVCCAHRPLRCPACCGYWQCVAPTGRCATPTDAGAGRNRLSAESMAGR